MGGRRNKSITWRPASTVILVREEEGELQVYLLRRSPKSRFFPGSYVFPGGAVDSEDRIRNLWENHIDIGRDEISRQLGGSMTVEEILAHGISALRETFEEAGVFLGRHDKQRRETLKELHDRRLSGGLPKGWFWEWVVSHGWILSFSNLARWAQWLTPELMPRHFDTRFFVAFMTSDQVCTPDTRETTDGIWLSPRKALARNLEGDVPLSPPTLVTLHELLEYLTLADLKKELEARTWGEPRFPRMIRLPMGTLILQPWDPKRYEEVNIDTEELEKAVLPVGEPFSRLWFHEGIWRPVAY